MTQTPLTSDNHLDLAYRLSDLLIETVRSQSGEDGKVVAGLLSKLRDAVWPKEADMRNEKDLTKVFRGFNRLNVDQKTLLLEAYARMGCFYEIAGQAARNNYFDSRERQGRKTPGGVDEFIHSQTEMKSHQDIELAESARLLTEQLNQPVFEVVMTAHPTNTNSLESMQAQREISLALEAHDEERLRKAVVAFGQTPVLHRKNGDDANFTVRDETKVMLNYLGNIYEDLPKVYETYDTPMKKKFGDAYNPAKLKLNMRFGSWGSAGDKDGNDNVTAETTLEAIARHTANIVERYQADLASIDGMDEWKSTLKKAGDALAPLLKSIEKLSDDAAALRAAKTGDAAAGRALEQRFNDASQGLQAIRASLDAGKFEEALLQAYDAKKSEDKLLDLVRKVRVFGFNFAKIEYRETANEYHRVASLLLERGGAGEFADARPQEQATQLTALLQAPGAAAREKLEALRADIVDKGAALAYDKKNPLPIAYHTMKRMELARDFPDMIRDNVLAECGRIEKDEFKKKFSAEPGDDDVKYTGVVNMLEARMMQRMVEKDGKTPLLGIVPLFEEPDTMKRIDVIMRGAYENDAYQAHLRELAQDRQNGRKAQQVQIAHSDNARRSGLLAARAYIHEAHKKMRELNQRFDIGTEFFEGGSISDAYRNGVRAVSASINAFDLQDFAKFTYQGGDLMNYFNSRSSTVRVFSRNLTKSAERFARDASGKWALSPRGHEEEHEHTPNAVIDELAIRALEATLNDYEVEDFKKDKMGVLLAALDYNGETKAGNRGSRAGSRNAPPAFGKVSSVQEGIREGIDVEDLRTIGFSEAWQQSGIVPSWIGSQKLADHLFAEAKNQREAIQRTPQDDWSPEQQFFMSKFGDLGNGPLTPAQIHLIYEKSPTFRDAQDRAAFALSMTDPQSLKWLGKRLERVRDEAVRKSGNSYLEHMLETHQKAGRLAMAALKPGIDISNDLDGRKVRAGLAGSLDRLTEDVVRKTHYRDFLLYAKIHGLIFPSLHTGNDSKSLLRDQKTIDHLRGLVHNGGDYVVHGRFLMADDPAYGASRAKEMHRHRRGGAVIAP